MTFRDDHDAALARSESLDREVKRLEAENAKLRVERERLAAEAARQAAEDRAETEQRAAQAARSEAGYQTLAQLVAKRQPQRPATSTVPDPTEVRHQKLQAAFALRGTTILLVLAAPLVVLAIPVVVSVFVVKEPVLIAPLFIAMLVGFFFSTFWVRGIDKHRTLGWLERLALPLDREAYLDFIATNFSGTLRLEIDVDGAGAERDLVEQAAIAGSEGGSARWSGDTLLVTSPLLATRYAAKHGFYHHNLRAHRWFRRLVTHVLLPMADRHRITAIRIAA